MEIADPSLFDHGPNLLIEVLSSRGPLEYRAASHRRAEKPSFCSSIHVPSGVPGGGIHNACPRTPYSVHSTCAPHRMHVGRLLSVVAPVTVGRQDEVGAPGGNRGLSMVHTEYTVHTHNISISIRTPQESFKLSFPHPRTTALLRIAARFSLYSTLSHASPTCNPFSISLRPLKGKEATAKAQGLDARALVVALLRTYSTLSIEDLPVLVFYLQFFCLF